MLRAMVFIDFENFDIAKYQYYKNEAEIKAKKLWDSERLPESSKIQVLLPRLDYSTLPQEIVRLLPTPHVLVKTYVFAPMPDKFLLQDSRRSGICNLINGIRNIEYLTVIEGRYSARPTGEYTYETMDINNPASFYVEEKGSDVNLATHVITKGFMNAYDTAIILSGDSDYIPVLDTLSVLGKATVVVGVQGQNLSQLSRHSDSHIYLDDAFFQSCLRHDEASVL